MGIAFEPQCVRKDCVLSLGQDGLDLAKGFHEQVFHDITSKKIFDGYLYKILGKGLK